MERVRRGPASPERRADAARRLDLTGTPLFWLTIAVTLCAAVPLALFRPMRAWVGSGVLLMWTFFFAANAIRSRRTHSIVSAPVYLLAASLLVATALGLIEVQIWMVWLLGAGIITANLSERVFGKYL